MQEALDRVGRTASLPDHRVTLWRYGKAQCRSGLVTSANPSVPCGRRGWWWGCVRTSTCGWARPFLREGITNTVGIAVSARRCPDRPALIDELGVLTYRELDTRANAFAAALQQLPGGTPQMVGIMCRNHRGFVDALAGHREDRRGRAAAQHLVCRSGARGSGVRERPDVIVYDEEFSASVDHAVSEKPDTARIVAWTDDPPSTRAPSRR